MDKIYIVEEDDPYIEEFVQKLGFTCHGKDTFLPTAEMTPDVLRKSLNGEVLFRLNTTGTKLPSVLRLSAPGCPHRGLFYRLGKRKDIMISGDIGCYTLAAGAPYNAMDSTVCMGPLSLWDTAQQVFNRAGIKREKS